MGSVSEVSMILYTCGIDNLILHINLDKFDLQLMTFVLCFLVVGGGF
jgi:hypothetical protein